MAKSIDNSVLDAALNDIKNNGERLCWCSAEPTTYTEAITTYKLADLDVTSTEYTGPADGDVSGRKLTIDATSGVTIDSTGTITHLAIVDVGATTLKAVTTVTSQAVTSGNTLSSPATDIEFTDPT